MGGIEVNLKSILALLLRHVAFMMVLVVACGGGSQAAIAPSPGAKAVASVEVEPSLAKEPTPEPANTATLPLPSPATDLSSSPPSLESMPELPVAPGEAQIILADGSVARYLVQEQLARLDVPNDAAGSTRHIEGHIKFGSDGTIQENISRIRVDLRTLRSDKTRRDQHLRRNTFESDRYPFAEFVVREAPGLQWPLPTVGESTFQLIGDMTIHGVTAPLTWDVDVSIVPEGANGQARTSFPFHVFDMEIPSLLIILSVEDNIRLEVDLNLDIVTGS